MTQVHAARVLLDRDPYVGESDGPDPRSWHSRSHWPAHWVGVDGGTVPFVAGYRLRLRLDAPLSVRAHVSADERYELYVDGLRIGRGPDRGDVDHWSFESFDLELPAGDHVLAARVWTLGPQAPFAQMSRAHGFLFVAEGHAELTTGTGAWESVLLPGHGFRPAGVAWGCGLKLEVDGARYPWGWQTIDAGLPWASAPRREQATAAAFANDMPPNRLLIPSILPPQFSHRHQGARVRLVADFPGGDTHALPVRARDCIDEEVVPWQALVDGTGSVGVPGHTRRRVLIDLDQYVCGYPFVRLSGGTGSEVRVHWQEGLFDEQGLKGNRDEIEGKRFRSSGREEDGVGDLFRSGGGQEEHTTLWWEAGRYVEVTVETEDEALTIDGFDIVEDRYPYEDLSTFTSSDPRLEEVKRLGFRTLQMCSHETTMDCPFYEQLQYAGDTRLQLLVAYVTQDDDRLARQALLAFDRSRLTDGLTRSRYPSLVRQTIPPFSLWWVAMVHDFALWRGDMDFVRGRMPGVRAVLDAFAARVDADGLLHAPDGWNFTDWVDAWAGGAPPDAHWGVSGVLTLQLAHVARLAAELEGWVHEPHEQARHSDLADRVRAGAEKAFWDGTNGMYADDLAHDHYSEHAQVLALLAGAAHGEEAVTATFTHDVERTTVYFDHYLFEALGRIGRVDVLQERLRLWYGLLDGGLRTVIEKPEPSRSDCHAWGAHPIFHLYATVLGVRPTAPGMAEVTVRPQLGSLSHADGTLRTPHGPLRVTVDEQGTVHVAVPDGIRQV